MVKAYGMMGMEPQSAVYKANGIPAVLSLKHPDFPFQETSQETAKGQKSPPGFSVLGIRI